MKETAPNTPADKDAASWVALGEDVRFDFQVGPADHITPKVQNWQLHLPLLEDLAGNNFMHLFEVNVNEVAEPNAPGLKRELMLR